MAGWTTKHARGPRPTALGTRGVDWPAALLKCTDASLAGVIFVAPLFLGGRHDVGRFVFASLVAAAAAAWFGRQGLLGRPTRAPRAALALLAACAAMLVVQIAPLPVSWLAWLTPRTGELVKLWAGGDAPGTLGAWHTASIAPEATRLSLAMLATYALLFVTVFERAETEADVTRLVKWVGLSAGLMATIGLIQYAAPNGKFLWIYDHPTRDAGARLGGAFANRNHFAHFLALGAPALAAWLTLRLPRNPAPSRLSPLGALGWQRPRERGPDPSAPLGLKQTDRWQTLGVAALLIVVCVAALLSASRGGALALATSGGVMAVALSRAGLVHGRQVAALGAAGLAVFLGVSLVGYDEVAARLGSLASESLDEVDAGGGRRRIWLANLAAIRAGGVLGSGAGSHLTVAQLYTPDLYGKRFTHAESGYLQIVTENGLPGAILLGGVLGVAALSCWSAWRAAPSIEALAYASACIAALAASAVHSVCDFVWYIPACMATTLVLAACVCRMAAQSGRSAGAAGGAGHRSAVAWAVGAGLCAAFAIGQLWAPARAASSWDAYLRMADAHRQFEDRVMHLPALEAQAKAGEIYDAEVAAYDAMIGELSEVVRPGFGPAHQQLANRLVQLFNMRQSVSDNQIPLSQVRDAAIGSQFASAAALRAWLDVAVGENCELMYRAWTHARQAAALTPLEGEPYLRLAELCFLEGKGYAETDEYLLQAIQVRPFDGTLLFEAGRQCAARGDDKWARACWQGAFKVPGAHRILLARVVAQDMPAPQIIELFAPEWDSLPELWSAYRTPGAKDPAEAATLLNYAREQATRETDAARPEKAAFIWRTLGQMQREAGLVEDSVASFDAACRLAPDDYTSRKLLGLALCDSNRLADGYAQLQWCRDRRQDDEAVAAALVRIGRERLAAQPELTR